MAASLSWEAFQEFFLLPGEPKAIRLPGATPATLFVSEQQRVMGLRLPAGTGAGKLQSPFRQIEIRVVPGKTKPALELSTSARPLFKEFFLFAMDVAHAVQQDDVQIADAVEQALRSWTALLQRAAHLSEEAEVGLIGELLLLKRVASKLGDEALSAWTGPTKEPHDFRLALNEIEVKTTLAPIRTHLINSWEQLVPSQGMPLYLLSMQLEPAGQSDGFTLSSLVAELRESFGSAARVRFNELLEDVGFVPEDAAYYTDRFRQRTPNVLIPVDKQCPRLNKSLLKLSAELTSRIPEVHYRINVDGLGTAENTAAYAKILPKGKSS